MKKVEIHSDGGCHGNPGPGGWAAVLRYGGHTKELSGGELATTNNRMELLAAISAFQALREPCEVEFFTDSQYVKQGIESWVRGWRANGWRTVKKEPVKNEDLWRALDAEASKHRVVWRWLKGHAGHPLNERCDVLATGAIEKIKAGHSKQQLQQALKEFSDSQRRAEAAGDLFASA